MKFDYNFMPGQVLDIPQYLNNKKPVISIITPYYKSKEYIQQTAYSVLNQTYPFFEWIIVCDGKQPDGDMKVLSEIVKLDKRIKLLRKENSGPAQTRDYGAKNASNSSKYFFFLDADDVIENNYLEQAYWSMETNKDAAWCYGNVVNFGIEHYLWNPQFSLDQEKKQNLLVVTALIRKDAFWDVGGYNLNEKRVYEDWNLWLKLFAKGYFPIHLSDFLFWYRRKENGELSQTNESKKRTMEIINKTVESIQSEISIIEYPRENFHWNKPIETIENIVIPKRAKDKKIKILMIVPWLVMGGADKFNLDLLKLIDKNKFEIVLITTEPNINSWQQEFKSAIREVHNLPSFLDRNYWLNYLEYIIDSRNIDIIFNTNSVYGYYSLPYLKMKYPELPIMDYIHMEEWYNRNGGYSRDSSVFESIIDLTLTCNKNSQNILGDYFKRDRKLLDTIYIGVDEKQFNPEAYDIKSIKEKYNIPTDKKVITFIARIDYQKRPFLLMNIIKNLKKNRKDCVFLIIGNGPLLDKIKKISVTDHTNDMVFFLGAHKEVREFYAISDLTLNCSIKEGLALTTYESLSMGIPVVSANVGGQAEIIDDTVGRIVPCLQDEKDIYYTMYSTEEINSYVNAIIEVLDKNEIYKKNSRAKILNGFTLNHMVKNMEAAFEKVYSNPSKQNIENGKNLITYKNMIADIMTIFLQMDKSNYEWACNQYYKSACSININQDLNHYVEKRRVTKDIVHKGVKKIENVFIALHLHNEAKIFVKSVGQILGIPVIIVKRLKKSFNETRK